MIRANKDISVPDFFLVGGWPTPLKNMSQLGSLFPIYGKIKHVSNHQPVFSLPVIMLSWGSFPPILTIQCSNSDTSPHNEKWLKRNESSRSLSAEPVRTYTTGERYFRNTAMATFSTSAGKQFCPACLRFSDQWIGILFRIYGHYSKSHDGSMCGIYANMTGVYWW